MHRRRLPILEPCTADWSAMQTVDAARRHCEQCRLDVHDLQAMTEAEARSLVRGGGVCVRYRYDSRGHIQFVDSDPRGPSLGWTAIAAAASLLALVGCASHEPLARMMEHVEPQDVVQWGDAPVVRPEATGDRYVSDPEQVDVVVDAPEIVPAEPCLIVDGGELMGLPVSNPPTPDFEAVVGGLAPEFETATTMGAVVVTRGRRARRAERWRERRAERRERRRQ